MTDATSDLGAPVKLPKRAGVAAARQATTAATTTIRVQRISIFFMRYFLLFFLRLLRALEVRLEPAAVDEVVQQDEVLAEATEAGLVVLLPSYVQRGRPDGGELVRLRAGLGCGVVVVLVEIGERQAVELRAELLRAKLARSRAFQSLEEEPLDGGRLRVGSDEDLDDSALAGDVDAMDDADFGRAGEDGVHGVWRLVCFVDRIKVAAETRAKAFEQRRSIFHLWKFHQFLFEAGHLRIEVFQVLGWIGERAPDRAEEVSRRGGDQQCGKNDESFHFRIPQR